MQYLVRTLGVESGPFSGAQLREMAIEGTLLKESLVAKVGSEKWTLASRVKGLEFSTRRPQVTRWGIGTWTFAGSVVLIGLILFVAVALYILPKIPEGHQLTETVDTLDIGNGIQLVASYDCDRIYVPADIEYPELVMIRIQVLKDGTSVEEESGLFNINDVPEEVTCSSSNPSVCECSSTTGYVFLHPKSEGEVLISITFLGETLVQDFTFIEVPIRPFTSYTEPQPIREIIQSMGFPDSKKTFVVEDTGEVVDGVNHQLTGLFEHWRFKQYPGLIVVVSLDVVIGIATERKEDQPVE